MNIRTASPADYPEITRISNAAMPHYALSVEQLHNRDATRDPICQLGYLLAEQDGQPVGYASYIQWIDVYHPQIFWVTLQVQPDHQRQGVGSALHQALTDTLAPFDPIAFKAAIYDGQEGPRAFSEKWGYREYSRRIESVLALQSCDVSAMLPRVDALKAEGVQIIPISDLMQDERAIQAIYDLQWALEFDVPMDEILTQTSLEQWRKGVIDSTMFVPEASFVAVENGQYIGLTEIYRYSADRLYIEFTGTLAAHRRRGIALAMKLGGILWGQKHGYATLGTTNDAVNTGVISLNRQLGFIPNPARIQIEKSFSTP